jgi:hypothetical protein
MKHALRLPDWEARLARHLAAWHAMEAGRARPGVRDCALFAGGCVQAVWGLDLISRLKGAYRSFRAGFALAGYPRLGAFAAAHFNPVPVALANRGDLAIVCQRGREAFAVVDHTGILMLAPDGMDERGGLALVDRTAAGTAWTLDLPGGV